ncbi:MAG: DUF421 domain-containing protein [Rubricoccaceae bacterium]
MESWFVTSPDAVLGVVLSTLAIYVVLIALLRLAGLRSFSKMSSFDFAVTVAIGSVIASTVLTPSPPMLQAAIALASLFGVQYSIAWLRKRTSWMEHLVDNEPLILMTREGMVRENMKRARVTEHDVWAKLREANVLAVDQIRAVVFETTGDISVLHGDPDGPQLEACLLSGVRGAERIDTVDNGNAERYV